MNSNSRALASPTIRATVEVALRLRRAAEAAADEREARRQRQLRYLEKLGNRAELDVHRSDVLWR